MFLRFRSRNRLQWLGALAALPLCACSTLGYYAHLAHGQAALLAARRPVARALADPAIDESVKTRLRLAEQARAFASDALSLPRNASYTKYADLQRSYAMWNVYAAPEFSLEAVPQCFPIAGCVAYRGYYELARADQRAASLKAEGFDTWVGGVTAYSTLGWFADPILNTMLRWDDDELASTIFHELAHQKLYVKGDTEFNESFATFVQREGLRQWRQARGLAAANDAMQSRADEFDALVLAARARLQALYASDMPPDAMRLRKRDEIERLRTEYFRLRDTRWQGAADYDAWINTEINNAKLLPFGLYLRWVDAFASLYKKQQNDWSAFYAAAAQIGRAGPAARLEMLERLAPSAR